MNVDLDKLSPEELDKLISDAEKKKRDMRNRRKEEVRSQITRLAKAEGYTIDELFGGKLAKASKGRTGKVPPKYRNPEDPGETWSGRGKRPRWFVDALERGMTEKDLSI